MKLPKYPCRSTVTGLQSTTTGSSVLIAQISVSPTVVAVTSHARCRRRIEAPKSASFRWSFAATTTSLVVMISRKMMLVTWGVEPSWKCAQAPAKSTAAKTGLGREFRAQITGVPVIFRQGGWHGYVARLSSFESVPTLPGTVAGNGRTGQVKVAGRFAGQTGSTLLLSLSSLLSLSFSLSLYIYIWVEGQKLRFGVLQNIPILKLWF